jgi:choline kinase
MVEHKVLITTSGLGSRLGELTNYTNKCLVRIADKPAISYIIESYPKDTKFVITLGHYGDHVKQFLELAYPDLNFTFIEVDKYKGEGSSLGYSILQCKHELNCPFIFHASDTIIKDLTIPDTDKNWIFGSYKEDSSQYRTVNMYSGKLININEKGEIGFDYSYVGISIINNFELFFYNLEKLIYSGHQDTSDVHVINNMLFEVEFNYKHIFHEDWFDVGNTSELIKTRKKFSSSIDVLDKKDESIFFFDTFVIKFFYDKTINKNRVSRAVKLKGLVPEIISHTDNFYKYTKAEGKLFSKSVNRNKFIEFLNWSDENLWIHKIDPNIENKCYDFYITKTKKRINQFLNDIQDKEEYINGELVPPIENLINSIDSDWLCKGIPSQFHGDFILDNIIETETGFTLIDWRQDFANDLEIGDMYYDLAKLNHNLSINHDIVNKNLFDYSKDNCYILINSKLNECKGVLHSFIKENGYDLIKVKILTSIIWINMAPLHEYPFNTFLFNFGKYNLYKNLKLWNQNIL